MRNQCIIFCILFFGLNNALAQSIVLSEGVSLIQHDGSLVVKKNWINNGRFQQNGGYVIFGGENQLLNGTKPTIFKNWLIQTGSTTNILSFNNVVQSILKVDGRLYVNDHLTLLSNANETALVDGAGIGTIHGILKAQAYLKNGYGYKYLGSPFQDATIDQMSNWVNLNASFPSVYANNENVLYNGWLNYMQPSNIMIPMKGYAFQMGNEVSPKLIQLSGSVNNGDMAIPLFNNNQPYTKGFNLISNPYPSPIDWDAAVGWNKINVDNAIYYFDADSVDLYGGQYNTYINGISSNGLANNIIPAFQSFFVHVSDGEYPVAGNLGFSNLVRLNKFSDSYRKVNSTQSKTAIKLTVKSINSNRFDNLVIYEDQSATLQNSSKLDAIKLWNTGLLTPNFYIISNNKKLAIHAINNLDSVGIIPLGISLQEEGMVYFNKQDLGLNKLSIHCYLHDKLLNKLISLDNDQGYETNLIKGPIENRFELVVSKNVIFEMPLNEMTNANHNFMVYAEGKKIYIKINSINSRTRVILTNLNGQQLFIKEYEMAGLYTIENQLSSGIYIIELSDSKNKLVKKIFIGE
jgi:hypothetical protein